jgi:methylglutaconyl-CoA hydratase
VSVVEFDVDSRNVATLTLNRPEIRNALNAEVISEVTKAVSGLPEDVRVLVLAGAGPSFSTGADLEWMRSMAGYSHEENLEDSRALQRMFAAVDECPVPVIGRIHGYALAGATGLVACSDYAVASESAVFSFTEVRIGLVPAVISPYILRKVGYSFARAMFLSAERFTAGRAYEVGLVHRVVRDDELDGAIEEVVSSMLEAGPQALAEAKKLLSSIANRAPGEVSEETVEVIAGRRVSEEGQEGMAAFFEKRKPRWTEPR